MQHHARPEQAAVLAHAPTFGLVATVFHRRAQPPRRKAGGPVVVGEELGVMLADRLVGGIALDPLGAGVPADDDAVRIEHVDGVIGQPVDQKPELPLALTQGLLGDPPLGHVADDVRKADQLPVVVDGVDHHPGPEPSAVLAHPPAVGLEGPVAAGPLQRARRLAGLPVVRRVETVERAADDLGAGIAKGPFRTDVPVGHQAARRQQADAIVLHAPDQQAQPALALLARMFRRLVAADQAEADEAAAAVADRGQGDGDPDPRAVAAGEPRLAPEPAGGAGGR